MAKKGYDANEKECPICGGVIWGRGQKVIIEGAKMTVCQSCAQYGTKVPQKPTPQYKKGNTYAKTARSSPRPIPRKIISDDIEIVADYAKRIRNIRSSRGLNQDQFAQKLNEKPSLLRRIEAGKVEPTIKLAKKIEQVYKIKLIKKVDETEPSMQASKYMKKSSGGSLGDIAYIKKKK